MKPSHIWITAVVAPMALLCLGAVLDGPDDHSAEMDQAVNLEQIQAQQEEEEKLMFVAQQVCGNGLPEWLADGTLKCTIRNGYRKAAL